ncbi:6275_t:CDS:2 [Scutellospora calospora]|uniref:6275_t:CDS:1 n=1 Tax=Scutellospora calospora TaxID=85575 RepID=A0ACA9JZX7_9GLOM|nr:6275_t:CDS:2 [Scutellospora calospora]
MCTWEETFDKIKHKNVRDNIEKELEELLDSWVDKDWTLLNKNIIYKINYELKELKLLLKLNSIKKIKDSIIDLIELNELSENIETEEESYDNSDEESEEIVRLGEVSVPTKKHDENMISIKNIGFNNIERVNRFIKAYHPEDSGVIVTNKNFSENSHEQAKKMKILICQSKNIVRNIKKEIERKKQILLKDSNELKELIVEVIEEIIDNNVNE